MAFFVFWRQHNPHFGVLLQLAYWVTRKAASFQSDSEQGKTMQQVQAAMQTAQPLEPHDPANTMVLEESAADRDATDRSLRFEVNLPSSANNYFPFKKNNFGLLLSLRRDWIFSQVTMRPELPTMKWVLSKPPSHKIRHAQQHYNLFWDKLEGMWWRSSSQWAEFWAVHLVVYFAWKRKWPEKSTWSGGLMNKAT